MADESISKSEALRRIAESTEQIRIYAATIKASNDNLQQVAASADALPKLPGG